jgi:hypothetical protein
MKLTQQTIRQIIKEELENVLAEEEVLEENILQSIKNFFKKPDPFEGDFGSFDENQSYDPGTYGQFVQSTGIIKKLKQKNIELKKNTISTAGQALIGSGDSKAGTMIGMALAVAGLIPTVPAIAAGAMGYAGLTAATIGLVKMFRKEPDKAKEYPLLKTFQMDEDIIEIIDDRLEDEIIEAYQNHFMQKVKSNPEEQMTNINVFARNWLAQNKNNRTVTAPGLPPPQNS